MVNMPSPKPSSVFVAYYTHLHWALFLWSQIHVYGFFLMEYHIPSNVTKRHGEQPMESHLKLPMMWRDPILWKKHQEKEQNRRSLFTLWGWSVDNSLFQKASEWFGVFYESVLLCDLCQDHALSFLSFLVCSFVSRCFVLCYMHTWVHAKQHRENHILEN